MTPRAASLQSRIILFHLLAIGLATVAVPLANYLVIHRSANLFETRILRRGQACHAIAFETCLRQTLRKQLRKLGVVFDDQKSHGALAIRV